MNLTSREVANVAALVLDLCGIVLDESKGYLIQSRLAPLCEEWKCTSFEQLVDLARSRRDAKLLTEIINAITTNETLFFRDITPFEALQYKALPELFDAKAKTAYPKRLRIWSAACSTGQEPYSIAMLLHELIPDIHSWDINILATDISDAALAQASRGTYSRFEIDRGLPANYVQRYFRSQGSGFAVADSVRALVAFDKQNLQSSFNNRGPFDVVFCRNVVIYFSAAARRSIFTRMADTLNPDGYLFVGSSESLSDLGPRFQPHHHCRSVFYRPNLLTPVKPATVETRGRLALTS